LADGAIDDRPLDMDALVGAMAKGCKPASEFRVGAEHEKFGYYKADISPIPYEGETGIHALLTGLKRFGWTDVTEDRPDGGQTLIGLERRNAEGLLANVSLEPGGQFELSGAPLKTMHDICAETGNHLREVREVADELGLGFIGLGHTPKLTRDQIPVMPKGRYKIMREYMPKVGGLGLDMMFRTCTVQANLDFSSEADMVKKFRMSLALQPVATALFANSPFVEGKPTGWLSSRARVWTDTDADRTGLLDFVFEDGFGFETYAEYALDVPMYFAKRKGLYVDLSGKSFRQFKDGKLDAMPGDRANIKDWNDHLTTLFPEVRLKAYLEMRGADSGPWDSICALPALWTGVFYDDAALEAAWDLAKDWTPDQRRALRLDAARIGLKAEIAGRSLKDVAAEFVAIAKSGLKGRAELSGGLVDETGYLAPLEEIADTGLTPADRLLELYHGEWQGDVMRVYDKHSY
jgi:glutamate--cysteine ligase